MRIFIGGDLVPTELTRPGFDKGDLKSLFGSIQDLVQGSPFFINLECALTDQETAIRKCGPNLKGRPQDAQVLKKLGVTLAGLANNHTFDFGQPGLTDTKEALTRAGIPFTGVGDNEQLARQPYFFQTAGQTIAVVAVAEHEYCYALPDQPGAWAFDPFQTMEDISLAKKRADHVIVIYHGGKEQSPFPSPRLRKACQAMARAGASAVFCQHSHCIGSYEIYRGSHLLYGQGNFNFLKYLDHEHWFSGLLLELVLKKDTQLELIFHPVVVKETGVDLAQGEEKARLLQDFQNRNGILQDETAWLKKWQDFCQSVAPNYRRAAATAFENDDWGNPAEVFPHYLDCEAHLDVWQELFQTWHRKKTSEKGTYQE